MRPLYSQEDIQQPTMNVSKQENKRHWGRYLAVFIFFIIPLFLMLLIFVISDDHSLVPGTQVMNTDTATNSKALARELRNLIKSPEEKVEFQVSEEEINSLVAFASRAIPRLNGHVSVAESGVSGTFSLHVPENFFGEYINVRFGVLPSASGLDVTYVSVGNITLPGSAPIFIVRHFTNLVFGEQTGDRVFDSVQSLAVTDGELSVTFRPIPDIKDRLKKLGDVRDEMGLLGDLDVIRRFYAKLCEIDDYYPHDIPMSAMAYVAPIFAYANQFSYDAGSAVKANQAAMLALGIYLGSDRFEVLVGDLQSQSNPKCRQGTQNVVFRNRHDMVQHFFISSTMKILSDNNISFAIGEYKELVDTTTGGLSVSDIAGNVAGIRFAELVLNPNSDTLSTQRMIADSIEEDVIFPDLSGMPPKLKREEFEKRYGDVEDPRYRAMLADIDARISRLSIYRMQQSR
jgi:hypothetical protein